MVTGFNTDVQHNGRVFHVQTEERGPSNPVVVTLVYCGGQVVTALEVSYAEVASSAESPEDGVRQIMQAQHRELIREILNGKFDPGVMPYGHDLISNRGLEELVLDYLEQQVDDSGRVGQDGPLPGGESSELDLAAEARRLARTGRVLNRLERMLTAAQRVHEPEERPLAHPVRHADPVGELPFRPAAIVEAVGGLPHETAVGDGADRDERRTPVWLWAAAALAVVLGGAIGLIWIGRPTAGPPARSDRAAATALVDAQPVTPAPRETPAPSQGPEVGVQNPQPRATEPPAAAQDQDPLRPRIDNPAPPATTVTSEPDRATRPAGPSAGGPPAETPGRDATLGSATPAEPTPPVGPVPAEPVAPQLETTRGQVVDPADLDLLPRARKRNLPRYTPRARRLRQEGSVQLRILVDEYGTVEKVELVEGIAGSDLDDSAIEVARGWEFSPARKDGEPVRVWRDVTLEFSMLPNRTTSVRIQGL